MSRLFQGGLHGDFPRTAVSLSSAAPLGARRGGTFGLVKPAVTRAYQGSRGWEQDIHQSSASLCQGCAKGFTHPPVVPQPPREAALVIPHFTVEETDAQGGWGTCPRSLGWEGLKPESFCWKSLSPMKLPVAPAGLPQFLRSRGRASSSSNCLKIEGLCG